MYLITVFVLVAASVHQLTRGVVGNLRGGPKICRIQSHSSSTLQLTPHGIDHIREGCITLTTHRSIDVKGTETLFSQLAQVVHFPH